MIKVRASYERRRERLVDDWQKKIKRDIEAESLKFVELYEKNPQTGMALFEVYFDVNFISTTYTRLHRDVFFEFYNRAKKAGAKSAVKSETFMQINMRRKELPTVENIINEYLVAIGGTTIKEIGEETLLLIKNILIKTEKLGVSIFEKIKVLRREIKNMSAYRAERIARTETTSAAGFGAFEGAKSTGLDLEKVWLSTLDKRTRGSKKKAKHNHLVMYNQRQKMDELFIDPASGEGMMYVCDRTHGATAGNIVNCRCTMIFQETE